MAQLIFILFVAGVIALLFRSRDTAHGRAWKRLLLIGFGILLVVTILAPGITSEVAQFIGIGRGADLVFYLTSFALMLLAALVYLKFKRMDERIEELTRQLAMARWDWEQAGGQPDLDRPPPQG